MPQSRTLSIGMAVQKDSIAVASVAQALHAEVSYLGAIGTRQGDLDQLIRPLQSQSKHRVLVYAAGPCGYWLSRSRTKKGHACWVVAPSLIPPKAGDRGTTHRRDALQLARLRRSGALTPVSVPQVADEARRDLVMRRQETLAPRARPAPDGPKEGGGQPTARSVLNRRVFLAPALPMDADQEDEEHATTSVAYS